MNLEDKIVKAEKLGIKFKLIASGQALPPAPNDTLYISPAWTDEMFERELDKRIEKFNETTFLGILSKHKLI